MSGTCKGFTLVEVLLALIILSVCFTVLLDLISDATKGLEEGESTFSNLLTLDRKLKLFDYEGLDVNIKELPDFPRIKEVTYSYKNLSLTRYEAR